MNATTKATNVTKQAKVAGKAWCGEAQSVAFCVAAFSDYLHADKMLSDAKALWDAARAGLRIELARAWKFILTPTARDAYKGKVRAALVKAKVCSKAEAIRLVNNQLIALGITGQGARKGGKRKGAGRKESDGKAVAATLSDKDVIARNLAAVAYIADAQRKHEGDSEMLETLGELLAILTAKRA